MECCSKICYGCYHCKKMFEKSEMQQTNDGDFVCEQCAFNNCERCLKGDPEIEFGNKYICSNCYSGMIDDACEMMNDR